MKKVLFLAWLLTFAAAVFFAYALRAYLTAGRLPAPVAVRQEGASLPRPEKGEPVPPSSRYAPLLGGGLFFPPVPREEAGEVARPAAVYVSALALRGIVLAEGRPPMAVLTRAGAPPTGESWTVRVGETVLGETVVAIDRESVTLQKDGQKTVLFLPGR